MKHCDNCGNKLEVIKENAVWYCPHCKRTLYANPIPTVDAMFFDEEGKILLGRRNQQPNKGKLNLPGGFVDPDETFEVAIKRELGEELNLSPSDYGKLTYAGSRVDLHTQEGKRRQLLSVIMTADIAHREFDANEEVSEYQWRLPSTLSEDELTTKDEYDHIMAAVALRNSAQEQS